MGHLGRLTMVAAMAMALSLAGFGLSATTTEVASAGVGCTPGYKPCIKNKRSDVDCYGGGGNGPRYTKPGVVYTVTRGKDRYGLDSDRDGKGCERR